eukprot:827017_1
MSTGKQTNQEGNGTGNIDVSNARSNHLDQCMLFGIGSTARDIVLFSVAFHRSKYRLMDALARLCQCKLKYMEQHQYKRNVITSPDHNVEDVYDNMDEEKQLLDNGMEEKHHPLHPQHHHRKASSLVAFNEQHKKHWFQGFISQSEVEFGLPWLGLIKLELGTHHPVESPQHIC